MSVKENSFFKKTIKMSKNKKDNLQHKRINKSWLLGKVAVVRLREYGKETGLFFKGCQSPHSTGPKPMADLRISAQRDSMAANHVAMIHALLSAQSTKSQITKL